MVITSFWCDDAGSEYYSTFARLNRNMRQNFLVGRIVVKYVYAQLIGCGESVRWWVNRACTSLVPKMRLTVCPGLKLLLMFHYADHDRDMGWVFSVYRISLSQSVLL